MKSLEFKLVSMVTALRTCKNFLGFDLWKKSALNSTLFLYTRGIIDSGKVVKLSRKTRVQPDILNAFKNIGNFFDFDL